MGPGNMQIKQGDRYFHYGYIVTKQKQDAKKCIQIVQRHLIREAMAQELPEVAKPLAKGQAPGDREKKTTHSSHT